MAAVGYVRDGRHAATNCRCTGVYGALMQLEEYSGFLARSLPVNMDGQLKKRWATFDRTSLPKPPDELLSDAIAVKSGSMHYSPSFKVDQVIVHAQPETYRQLGLLCLAVLFHPDVDAVDLHLRSPRTEIETIRIRYRSTRTFQGGPPMPHPAPFHSMPHVMWYWIKTDRDAVLLFDPEDRPYFVLTNASENWHDDESPRTHLLGFSHDQAGRGLATLSTLLLDLGAPQQHSSFNLMLPNIWNERAGVCMSSAELSLYLPTDPEFIDPGGQEHDISSDLRGRRLLRTFSRKTEHDDQPFSSGPLPSEREVDLGNPPVVLVNRFAGLTQISEECNCGRYDRSARHFHTDTQDTTCEAWQMLLALIDEAADDGREEFAPGAEIPRELWRQIVTLPPSLAKLGSVKRLNLYGSNLVMVPPEIGELKNLEDFRPYTSRRLHWFPFEITRCTRLVDSTVSTRNIYGNFKYRTPFPQLPAELPSGSTPKRCSVCNSPLPRSGALQVWISLRVATDVLPLLVHSCSEECIRALPTPSERYVDHPHQGGPELVQPEAHIRR
jgi:hypothetical protein